jgi:tetratricopeptide (TPR) repeat protein
MEKIDFSSYIEKYIGGEMSNAERRWFEKELEGNEALRHELDLRKKTDQILKGQDLIKLRSKLVEIERTRKEVRKPVWSLNPVAFRYAAVIILLMAIGTLVINPWSSMTAEEILEKYSQPYEPPTSIRSATNITTELFTKALQLYNTHDYEKAAELFSEIIESNPKDMESTLLNGVANFENNKYPEAKQSFTKVIDDNNNLFIDQAEWYLALCYIKTGENDKAKSKLTKIKQGDGIYKKDAKDILKLLK